MSSERLAVDLQNLGRYDVPEYVYLQASLNELNSLYEQRKEQEAWDIVSEDILVHNMVANNIDFIAQKAGMTAEEFENLNEEEQDASLS